MSYRYDPTLDRMIGHDWPGVHGQGFDQFMRDEVELGARVALALDDPDQWWWVLHVPPVWGIDPDQTDEPSGSDQRDGAHPAHDGDQSPSSR